MWTAELVVRSIQVCSKQQHIRLHQMITQCQEPLPAKLVEGLVLEDRKLLFPRSNPALAEELPSRLPRHRPTSKFFNWLISTISLIFRLSFSKWKYEVITCLGFLAI